MSGNIIPETPAMAEAIADDMEDCLPVVGQTPPSRQAITADAISEYDTHLTGEQRELFRAHIHRVEPIAQGIASKYGESGQHEIDEAVGDGYLGLLRGVHRFDPAKVSDDATTNGNFFARNIESGILHGMRGRYGRKYGKGGVDKIEKLKPSVVYDTASSLEQPLTDNEHRRVLGDLVPSLKAENALHNADFNTQLVQVLRGYQARDRAIFLCYVILDQTQSEIGEAVGLSQMHVSRIVKKIFEKFEIAAQPESSARPRD